MRRVVLGERHRARVKPDVDHLCDAAHRLAALRARERDLVDERAMGVGELDAREVTQLRIRADHLYVLVAAAPHRQRRPPVALARQRPVDVALEPVSEAAVLDVVGVPVDGLVGREQAVLDLARSDVPGRLGVIDQRRVAAPAVRIGVLELLGAQQLAARTEILDQVGIGVLDVAAGIRPDALVVGSVGPHRIDHVQAVLLAETEVLLAERDRGVHQTRAVVGGDEVAEQHGVSALAVRAAGDEVKRRLVGDTLERRAGETIEDLRALAEHALDERLGRRSPPDRRRPSRGRRSARGRRRPPRWTRASTAWSSRSAARRPPARRRWTRSPGSGRRPTGRSRPGRRPAGRARGWTALSRTGGSTGRP